MDNDQAYLQILKRVGLVLIVVGVSDVAVMIYCIAHRIAYGSSFNVFAIIAGVFLMRGSLRAARLIAEAAAFMLTGFLGLVFVWPVFLPPSLALAQLRIYPMRFLAFLAVFGAMIGLLFWIVRQLRGEAVLSAIARSAGNRPSLRGPVLTGAAIVGIVVTLSGFTHKSESARRAEQIAASQVGDGYSLKVTEMRTVRTASGKTIHATVTAWKDHEIRQIPVTWDEQ
jgi:hypothetical protein